jgi:hypothetical protein
MTMTGEPAPPPPRIDWIGWIVIPLLIVLDVIVMRSRRG